MVNVNIQPSWLSKLNPTIRRSVFGKDEGMTRVIAGVPESLSKKRTDLLGAQKLPT